MAQELSTTERLRQALAQWPHWESGPECEPTLVRQLDGKSNDSFLVAANTQQFVIRLNSLATHLGVDRATELQILTDIAAADFAPEVVFASADALVTRYLPDEHPSRRHYHSWLDKAGHLFRAIHTTPTSVSTTLHPIRHAHSYFAAIETPDPVLSACFDRQMRRPAASHSDLCLCHNDLLCSNLIAHPDRWVAIDWEYAALGDPAFDLAVLLETLGADESDTELLLKAYGSDRLNERIPYYRDLYRLIEVLWWRLRYPQEATIPGLSQLATRLDIQA